MGVYVSYIHQIKHFLLNIKVKIVGIVGYVVPDIEL